MTMRNVVSRVAGSEGPPAPEDRPLRPPVGYVGIASGLLFLAMLVWEYSFHDYSYGVLSGADVTTHSVLNQIGFTIALAGYAVLAFRLLACGATGRGLSGRVAVVAFAAGFAVLAVADVLDLLGIGNADSSPLLPIGGLLQTLGGLAVGIMVALARSWRGWQRWWPLILAVYWLTGMFLPLFAGVEPDFPREALWSITVAFLGLAVLTDGGRLPLRAVGPGGREAWL
jgi:hypothetical protein